jgi:hypothetical protein
LPGEPAEKVRLSDKTTYGELIDERNLSTYEVSVNGSKHFAKSTTVSKDDVIRAGMKTKNG